MKVSLFYLPSVGNKAQIPTGRVGSEGELYDQMLHEVSSRPSSPYHSATTR